MHSLFILIGKDILECSIYFNLILY